MIIICFVCKLLNTQADVQRLTVMDVVFVFVFALLYLYNFIIFLLFDHLYHCVSARYAVVLKERQSDGDTVSTEGGII